MRWQKKGQIFTADRQHEWMAHHAYVPIADKINDEVIRIYFGTRDHQNRTVATFIEVEAKDPSNVLYVHDRPVLGLGQLGTFDDNGVKPSCIVTRDDKKYLFYVGWNRTVTVPYRNAIGVAISEDGGLTFKRLYEGPIIDRNPLDPYFIAGHFVMIENGIWRIWYGSSTGWDIVNGQPEPRYLIKYAESSDVSNWVRKNQICLSYKFESEAISRPSVIKENGGYRMWYCFRGNLDYRTNKAQSYRIGYAESSDGISWTRKDEQVGIEPSETGWDSIMVEYPFVYYHKEVKYMLYNGNGFGETGFGYAVMTDD